MAVCFYITVLVVFTLLSPMRTTDKNDYKNSAKSITKSWMAYLTYTVERWLQNTELTIVQYWQEVRYPVRRLISWCEPTLDHNAYGNETKLQIHIRRWRPCGYGFYHSLNRRHRAMLTWTEIQVYRMYYLHFVFLYFELDDSNDTCQHSALHIMKATISKKKTTWTKISKYCGCREPWNVTIESSMAAFYVNHVNVYRLLNITMKYVTFDRSLKWLYRTDPNVTHIFFASHLVMKVFQIDTVQHQWIIKVDLGFVQRLETLWISRTVKFLHIFDGLKKWFPLVISDRREDVNFNKTINRTTRYFQSHMVLIIDNPVFNDTLMKLTFGRWKIDTFHLRLNTETHFSSSDQIIYSVFSLKPDQGMFPVLIMTFRKFQGWNLGGCNYGGYAIQQNIDDPLISPTTIGPFCSTTSPRYEYTSQNVLPEIVMNNRTAHLIIYGNGLMYAIDLDIEIDVSPCEGMFEPLLMWYPDHGNTRLIPDDVLTTTFATVSLEVLYSNMTPPLYIITFQNISRCFFMQSFSYPNRKRIYYDILLRGDFKTWYYKPPRYIEKWIHGSYGNVWVKFIRLHEKPVWRQFTVSSRMNVLDILQVSFEHYTGEAYDYVNFLTIFTPVKETVSCVNSNDELTTPPKFIKYKGNILATTYKSCFLNMLEAKSTYAYVLNSKLSVHQYTSKSNWYIHFLKVGCDKIPTQEWDTITTRLTVDSQLMTSHTVDFVKDEVYLESRHSSMSFVYRRRQNCTSVVMRYRDVSINLLASYIEMDNHGRARIRVNIITCTEHTLIYIYIYIYIQINSQKFCIAWQIY